MNTYPVILAVLGYAPSRIITRNDTEIGAKFLKYDDKNKELVCELSKVIESKDLIIEIVALDKIWQYKCHITGPENNTKTIIQLDSLQDKNSELLYVVKEGVLILTACKDGVIVSDNKEEALPLSIAVDFISESVIYLKNQSDNITKNLQENDVVELVIAGGVVAKMSVKKVIVWGGKHTGILVSSVNNDILNYAAESEGVVLETISDKWDEMLKQGAVVL